VLAHIDTEPSDDGRGAARSGRARLCLATGEVKPIDELIRYVVAPDGAVVPDLGRKLPGRGAWITATRAALENALAHKAFARGFRGKAHAGPELLDLVDRLMEKAALSALSLANKAGQVVSGFAKVEEALNHGRVAVLVHAREAAADGVAKLASLARRTRAAEPARVFVFSGPQLDLALGRSNVVHAALLAHAASRSFLEHCQKLERWRTGENAGATVQLNANPEGPIEGND
jgi:predicted RNA-binding protein YlxR (DUF448 family)